MSKKLLSICILSYNQAAQMERLFSSLVPQMTDELEVVIRDDSTNDETEQLVAKYSDLLPIRYFRGERGGIDKTVIFLAEEAQGEFVWWLGDDEVLPGGVARVLKVIREVPDVTFIWANYRLADDTRLAVDLGEDRLFQDRNEVLVEAGAGLGFISATIFKRELALSGVEGANRYAGSLFSNLYLVLHVIAQPGKYYNIHDPVLICYPWTSKEILETVTQRGGSEVGNRGFEVYGITFPSIVREFAGAFSEPAIRRTIKRSFGQTWRGILVGWIGGWDSPKGKRLKMLREYWSFPECWVALMLYSLPLSVNKLLYRIYKALRGKQGAEHAG